MRSVYLTVNQLPKPHAGVRFGSSGRPSSARVKPEARRNDMILIL